VLQSEALDRADLQRRPRSADGASMRSIHRLIYAVTSAGLICCLAACDADEPSGSEAGHKVSTSPPPSVATPPVSARSQSASIKGGVGAPTVTSQGENYRLRVSGLQPGLREGTP